MSVYAVCATRLPGTRGPTPRTDGGIQCAHNAETGQCVKMGVSPYPVAGCVGIFYISETLRCSVVV